NSPLVVTISICTVLPGFGGFFVRINSPPGAIVLTREISCCPAIFQATIADFGALSLGYRRMVASLVIESLVIDRNSPLSLGAVNPSAVALLILSAPGDNFVLRNQLFQPLIQSSAVLLFHRHNGHAHAFPRLHDTNRG